MFARSQITTIPNVTGLQPALDAKAGLGTHTVIVPAWVSGTGMFVGIPHEARSITLGALLPAPPNGTQVSVYDSSGSTPTTYTYTNGAWSAGGASAVLTPGRGIYVNLNTTALTLVFTVDVKSPPATLIIAAGVDQNVTVPINRPVLVSELFKGPLAFGLSIFYTVPGSSGWSGSTYGFNAWGVNFTIPAGAFILVRFAAGTTLTWNLDLAGDPALVIAARDAALALKADATLTLSDRSASATLALADNGHLLTFNAAGAVTLTVPGNAAVAFPVGTQVLLAQTGAGAFTVTAAGSATVNSVRGFTSTGAGALATLVKIATDTWLLTGDLA